MKLKAISLAVALLATQSVWASDEFEVYVGSKTKDSGFEEYKGSAEEKVVSPKVTHAKKKKSERAESNIAKDSNNDIELVLTKSSSFRKVEDDSASNKKSRASESDSDKSIDEVLSTIKKHSSSKKHFASAKKEPDLNTKIIELTDKNKSEVVAPRKNEFIISNDPLAFNEVNVPFPIVKVVIPSLVPIDKEKFVYENENKRITFSFKSDGFNRTFPAKFIGENQSVSILLTPKPLDVGQVVNVKAEKTSVNELVRNTPQMMPREVPTEADIQLMNKLMDNNLSDDFTEMPLPKVSKFENAFIAVPLMKKSNGSKNVLVFQLVSTNNAVTTVANKQFYKPGVVAVSLDRQTVEPNKITHLYIIEEADDNGR